MSGQPQKGQLTVGGAEPYPTDPYSELPDLADFSIGASSAPATAAPDLKDKGAYPKSYLVGGSYPILEVAHQADNTASNANPVSWVGPGLATHIARAKPDFWDRTGKFISNVDNRLSQAELVNESAITMAGVHAFRNYNWLSHKPATNAVGDLRGMVVNAKSRAAFRLFTRAGKYMENIGLVAGFVAGMAEAMPEIHRIKDSNDPISLKGARIVAIAGTAAQRAILGTVPYGAHLVYKSLQRWCMIAGVLVPRMQFGANQCIATLRYADTLVRSTFKTVTNTANQSRWITHPRDDARAVVEGAKEVWLVVDTVLHSRQRE